MERAFRDIAELLRILNREQGLIAEMFNKRKQVDFSMDDARAFVKSEDNLALLIDLGVIRQEGPQLELEEIYLKFFEDVLQVNEEVSNATVAEQVARLRESIDFYLKERNNAEGQRKYMHRVKRTLRNIAMMARRHVVDLKRAVDDTFKHESNYEIKLSRLRKFREQIAQVISLINETEQLLDNERSTFHSLAPDEQLSHIVIDVRSNLIDTFHTLIDLQRKIRDYLHQIEAVGRLVKKIRRLKYLKDQLTWTSGTNVEKVLEERDDVMFEPQARTQLKPSLRMLKESDECLDALEAARRQINRRRRTALRRDLSPISPENMAPEPVIQDFVNTDMLAGAFFASGNNLFDFVMDYAYAMPQSLEQRVELYAEIAREKADSLDFTDEWAHREGIFYPIVYPRTR